MLQRIRSRKGCTKGILHRALGHIEMMHLNAFQNDICDDELSSSSPESGVPVVTVQGDVAEITKENAQRNGLLITRVNCQPGYKRMCNDNKETAWELYRYVESYASMSSSRLDLP